LLPQSCRPRVTALNLYYLGKNLSIGKRKNCEDACGVAGNV
jgi:hypothetical protein